jgi:hypothetical protein
VIYFFQEGAKGPIKIGMSDDVHQRFRQVDVGRGTLRVLSIIEGGFERERILHSRFAHLRISGEWFWPEPELVDFIEAQGTPWINPRRFAMLPLTLLCDLKRKPRLIQIVAILSKHARGRLYCDLVNDEIADELEVHRRTVTRALNQLEHEGWISRILDSDSLRGSVIRLNWLLPVNAPKLLESLPLFDNEPQPQPQP